MFDHVLSYKPFPHIVKDNLFESELLSSALREFDEVPGLLWRRYSNFLEEKYACEFGRAGTACRTYAERLASPSFRLQLEQIFGVPELTFDGIGGGLHRIEGGGFLEVHTDFNLHNGLYRRINCLTYLNKDWRPGDGGELGLYTDPQGDPDVLIEPVFGRTVIFATSDTSWHGHPNPVTRGRRLSLAGYYFSPQPYDGYVAPHSTVFKEKP